MSRCLLLPIVLSLVSVAFGDSDGVLLRGRFIDPDGQPIPHVSVRPLLAAASSMVP